MRRSDSQRTNGTSINEICILCRPIECVVVTARGPMGHRLMKFAYYADQ
ncbi:hypothetical protein T11_9002, partial [Trichinella zimbabwensis]